MKRLILVLGLALVIAACGDEAAPNIHLQIASGPVGVGQQRVLIAMVNLDTQQLAASPDVPATATLRDRIGSPLADYVGEFVWIVPNVRGLYAFNMDVPGPGEFQVTVDAGPLGNSLGPIRLTAVSDLSVVQIGEDAPRSITRTIPEYDLSDITSDPEPDPSFYEMTVAAAVESGRPSVIVFGTPAWCTSQACGPMLEQIKALAPAYPGLNFVHVEIFENIHVGTYEELVPVPSVEEWGLIIEPVIFVTDSNGVVSALFAGAASDNELRTAFDAVTG